MQAITVFEGQMDEAKKEILRISEERGGNFIQKVLFDWKASRQAQECGENYIASMQMGGYNIFCICGFHPSRRRS